jgi:hypothetical protein
MTTLDMKVQTKTTTNDTKVRINLTSRLDKMKKKTCGCEESELGYHLKECTLYPYGWNDALEAVKKLLKI